MGEPPSLRDLRNEAGQGVEARADGRLVRIGSRRFCDEIAGAPAPAPGAQVYLAEQGRWLAAFFIEDALRPEAADVVRALAGRGLRVHLVSGDDPALVEQTARLLGIEWWAGGATPQEKFDYVARLQGEGRVVAMVGDGLNDAPVLACADASVAMGAGADAAQLQADVVLTGDRLGALQDVLALSRGAMRLVRQNLGWALALQCRCAAGGRAGLDRAVGSGDRHVGELLHRGAERPAPARREDRMESSLTLLIPLSVALVFLIGWVFWRALEGGQFDDLERPAHDILMDDDKPE